MSTKRKPVPGETWYNGPPEDGYPFVYVGSFEEHEHTVLVWKTPSGGLATHYAPTYFTPPPPSVVRRHRVFRTVDGLSLEWNACPTGYYLQLMSDDTITLVKDTQ